MELTGLALNTVGSVLDVADLASMATTLAVVGAGATVGLLPLALPIIARKYRKRAVKGRQDPGPYLTKLQSVARKMSKQEQITDETEVEMKKLLEEEEKKISQDPEKEDIATLIHDTILRQNKTNQDLADFSGELVKYATRVVELENKMEESFELVLGEVEGLKEGS
jgi:signal transduction histidine kinase